MRWSTIVVAGAVELVRQQLFGQRHAHGVGQALAERAGGGLDARRDADFRMARRLAVQLAEVAQLAHRQVVAGEVQQRVQQHRAVAVGQHEAVAVGPLRVGPGCASGAGPTAPPRSRPCPSARPDGRELACCTASIASARMALAISGSRGWRGVGAAGALDRATCAESRLDMLLLLPLGARRWIAAGHVREAQLGDATYTRRPCSPRMP